MCGSLTKSVYWGKEKVWFPDPDSDERYTGDRQLENPLAAVQMGLIYVNPNGPNGKPDPLAAAIDIRETFKRMAMNDEETVALIAGGHSFGKAHGAGDAALVGPDPEAAPIEEMGFGWMSKFGTGKGKDAITGGPEVTWTTTPTKWSNNFFENLFGYEWELTKSPAGANQFKAKGDVATIPDPFDPSKRHAPTMLVTDLSLRTDPAYEKISRRFYAHPDEFADTFARAWFKLTHRDMGPRARYLGPEVPAEELIWQDPVPAVDHKLIDAKDIADLKAKILASGLSIPSLSRLPGPRRQPSAAPTSAAGRTGRASVSAPQKDWDVNQPAQLEKVLETLGGIQKAFNGTASGGKKVSLADLIVLGGSAAVEQAAKKGGHDVTVPFAPGRTDASQEQTDVESFAYLEPPRGRVPQLPQGQVQRIGRGASRRQGATVDADGARDDGSRWRHARLGCELRQVPTRRPHEAPGDAHQRLLCEPLGHGHRVESYLGRKRVRGARPRERQTEMDRHACRSPLRFEL